MIKRMIILKNKVLTQKPHYKVNSKRERSFKPDKTKRYILIKNETNGKQFLYSCSDYIL